MKALLSKASLMIECGDGFSMTGTTDNEIYFWGSKGHETMSRIMVEDLETSRNNNTLNNSMIGDGHTKPSSATKQQKTPETDEYLDNLILQPSLVLRLETNDDSQNTFITLGGLVCCKHNVLVVIETSLIQEQRKRLRNDRSSIPRPRHVRQLSAPELKDTTHVETWIQRELDDAEILPIVFNRQMDISKSTTSYLVMSRIGLFGQISEVTEHLYLSGAGVLKPEKLRQKQITCIINATVEEPNSYIPGIEYMKISIEDNPLARIDQYFDMVADKIKAVKDRGGKTLVHCVAGVSRSATLCIVYLMKHERMSLRQAYHYVKSARPIIRPNVGFWKQMIEYERRLRGAASVSMMISNQCDLTIPDVYCSELKRRIVQSKGSPKSTTTSGLISMQSLFGTRTSLPSSLVRPSTVSYRSRTSASPTTMSSSSSTFVPPFASSRYSSISLLNPAPSRRRGSSSIFDNLYHSEFSAF